jgi:ubiquinone biosynthesis monooxygenase Coq7
VTHPKPLAPLPIAPHVEAVAASLWPAQAWSTWPAALRRELRTDHAGEAGAVMIYRGVLAVARDATLREFARHHLDTEARHLALIEAVVPGAGRSRLLPLWRVAGWLTGALPACWRPSSIRTTPRSWRRSMR